MKDYKKYKWFYTSSEKLVVGGKSASQNDELIKRLKKDDRDYWVMHTSQPGSPFSVIISEKGKVSKNDMEETSVFTGCFSRAWKQGKMKAEVHVFSLSQLYKSGKMKSGTWGVKGKVKRTDVELKLALTKQKKVLRAVPEKSAKKTFLRVCPGKTDKSKMIEKIATELGNIKTDKNEILAALPAGGVRICR